MLLALLLRAMYGAVDLPNVGKFATVFSQFFGLYCRHEIVILSERQISLLGENYNGKTDIADGGLHRKDPLDTAGMYAVCINMLIGMGFTNERKEI